MNIIREIVLNQLIKVPAVKARAKKSHKTGISHLPENLDKKYSKLTRHVSVDRKDILELGPGMTIDIALRAKSEGAISIAIADIERYLSDKQTADNGINYKVYDGQEIPFTDGSFDLIWSSDVFEHIRYPKIIVEETYRLLRPGGLVVHIIDLKDHFSYSDSDPDITFNCLKYSERLWNLMTWNRSNYVNRLRVSDWIALHEEVGFKIIEAETETNDYIRDNYGIRNELKYLLRYSNRDAVSSELCLVARRFAET